MVRNNFYIILIATLSIFFVSSCQKASINGDLDGRWQIMEIERNNEISNVKDQQLYYSFYLHVCTLTYYGGVFTEANLSYDKNLILLDFPYINTPVGMSDLNNYGIYSNPVEFKVVYLDKKKLIMQNDESLITLRKF